MTPMNNRLAYRELVYEGAIAKGYRVGLRMPDGTVVPRDLFCYAGAVVILPVLPDGRIVLIRNYRFAVDEHLLELPAGLLAEGEEPARAAARELAEETGYTAGTLTALGSFYTGPGTSNEIMHTFLATDLRAGRQDLEEYEEITVEVHTQPEVREMVASGELHDGKTIATLALYWLREGL